MHTLVLDLHGGLPGLGAAEVLLYRFRAEGRLAWLGGLGLVDADDGALDRFADAVHTHLARHQVGAWQAVLVLDLPAGGDPLDGGALTDQLERAQQRVLAHLAAAGRRPAQVLAITLDTLERDHRDVPVDPAARLRWKLDTYGMARVAPDTDALLNVSQRTTLETLVERHPPLLDEADLAAVAATWAVPERPPGVRLDQRLDTLAPELRTPLEAGRSALLAALDERLGLDAKPALPAPPASRFVRREVLATVRGRFEEAVRALGTVEAWQRFDPEGTLRRIVRQTLGVEAVAAETTVLRLRLARQPAPARQRSLLELAYVVATLTEVADRAALLKAGQRYVARVELDAGRLAALAASYTHRLERALREVRFALDEPLVDSVDLVRDPDCGCRRTLDLRGRFEGVDRWTRVRLLRGTDDLRWDTWADSIARDLREAEAEADAHIDACVHEDAARFPSPQPHRLDTPLDQALRQEEAAYRTQQQALLAYVVPASNAPWNEDTYAEAIAPRLYGRPNGRTVALWALGSAVLLAGPYLAEMLLSAQPFVPERAWWLGGLALVGLLVALGVVVGRWLGLRRRWRAAALAAKEALAGVQARYRLRTARLAQGCVLRASHQRLGALHAAERDAGQRRLQLRHHETRLQQHLAKAASLLEGQQALPSPTSDPAPPDLRLGRGLDPARPAYANPVYHLTHRPSPPGVPPRLVVNRSEHPLDTPRLVGLDALTLEAE